MLTLAEVRSSHVYNFFFLLTEPHQVTAQAPPQPNRPVPQHYKTVLRILTIFDRIRIRLLKICSKIKRDPELLRNSALSNQNLETVLLNFIQKY
jgi:hypothetical protein